MATAAAVDVQIVLGLAHAERIENIRRFPQEKSRPGEGAACATIFRLSQNNACNDFPFIVNIVYGSANGRNQNERCNHQIPR